MMFVMSVYVVRDRDAEWNSKGNLVVKLNSKTLPREKYMGVDVLQDFVGRAENVADVQGSGN